MTLAIQLLCILISVLALIISLAALAMTIGMKLSTHRVEWKTLDFDKYEEPEDKKVAEEDDFLEKAILMQRKKKKIEDPLDPIAETSNF